MPRIRLHSPLIPNLVDAKQSEIAHLEEDGDVDGLRKVSVELFAQSERDRRKYPRDASTLSDLGKLAAEAARSLVDSEDS